MTYYYKTSFTVYPDDCNYLKVPGTDSAMVHGGTMLLKMDRAAAECIRKFLYETECDSALTVGVDDVIFYFGAKCGDLINIDAQITELGNKRITCLVSCYVEEWGGNQKLMAKGLFHFCSTKNGKSYPHNGKL